MRTSNLLENTTEPGTITGVGGIRYEPLVTVSPLGCPAWAPPEGVVLQGPSSCKDLQYFQLYSWKASGPWLSM